MKFNRLAILAIAVVSLLVLSACAPNMPEESVGEETGKEAMMEESAEQPADKEEMAEELEAKEEPKEQVSEEMKDYVFKTFDGQEVNLFNGEKTYVKVWASWCSVCISGLSELDSLYEAEKDFRVLNVVAPGQFGEMSEEKFIKWWKGLEADYPNIEIVMDMDGSFFKDMGVMAFPTSFYINSNNEVLGSIMGHNEYDRIFENMDSVD